MSYTLTLGNGKVLTGLGVNGTCFVSKVKLTAADFPAGMSSAVLSGSPDAEGGNAPYEVGRIDRVKLGRVFPLNGEYLFDLEQMSDEEFEHEKDRADIDYLAMMTGVEL